MSKLVWVVTYSDEARLSLQCKIAVRAFVDHCRGSGGANLATQVRMALGIQNGPGVAIEVGDSGVAFPFSADYKSATRALVKGTQNQLSSFLQFDSYPKWRCMLVITPQQMALLEQARRECFHNRLRAHLNSNARCSEAIAYVLSNAARFGLRRECDVAWLAEMLSEFEWPREQELPRPALAILCTYGADPEDKLRQLARWMANR